MNRFMRILKTDGWLYFSISFLPGIASFFLSEQAMTGRLVIGTFVASLVNGLIALKAFRSKSKETEYVEK